MSGFRFIVVLFGLLFAGVSAQAQAQNWENHSTADNSNVIQRHETGSVVSGNKLYVMGGRGNRPNQVFDASQNRWSTIAPLPMELHHFQPVVLNGYIYVIGAFTCCFPDEPSISDIYRLDLSSNTWETAGSIPANRLRGSAGAVAHNNKIYLIGGNTNGHSGGAVPWFDEYNPANGEWKVLPDAPEARDHFSAAVVGNRLVAAAGRTTNRSFGGMVAQTDTYNFNTNSWTSSASIPTPRAGSMIGVHGGDVIVIGGETDTQVDAHSEVEAFDVASNSWRALPDLNVGRHGGAGGVINNILHAITGNTRRGGGAEVTLHETLNLSDAGSTNSNDNTNANNTNNASNAPVDSDNDGLTDAEEQNIGTNPNDSDSDNDGLSDGAEINQHRTDPNKQDSDGDGQSDSQELSAGTSPTVANDFDSDNDGLTDSEEQDIGTDSSDSDSDNDGLSDGDEVNRHQSNPLQRDTDSDGLSDSNEIEIGTNPSEGDSDFDTLSDLDEVQTFSTNPLNADSDGDSLSDQDELQIYFTDPLLEDSDNDGLTDDAEVLIFNSNPNTYDTDGDGVSDATEAAEGTNLADSDQDGDGIINEAEGADDPDGDSLPNFLDLDSDNDGIPDIVENGRADTDNNGLLDTAESPTDVLFDADEDGIPNMLDLDSDQDGISDFAESGQTGTSVAGRFAPETFADPDLNGWHDDSLTPLDSDNDATPNYLDLDSDDNGVLDITENGQPDLDADGKLDVFNDADLDGFDDTLATLEPVSIGAEGDVGVDNVPNSTDTNNAGSDSDTDSVRATTGGPGGGGSTGLLLPISLLLLSVFHFVRRRASAQR